MAGSIKLREEGIQALGPERQANRQAQLVVRQRPAGLRPAGSFAHARAAFSGWWWRQKTGSGGQQTGGCGPRTRFDSMCGFGWCRCEHSRARAARQKCDQPWKPPGDWSAGQFTCPTMYPAKGPTQWAELRRPAKRCVRSFRRGQSTARRQCMVVEAGHSFSG